MRKVVIALLVLGVLAVYDGRPLFAAIIAQETFDNDPVANGRAVVVGVNRYTATTGALTAHYDTQLSTSKLLWSLGQTWTDSDSFRADVRFQVQSAGLAADPNKYAQMSFGFVNSLTTGTDRAGGGGSAQEKAYDSVALDYFPNISPTFGGPTVSPTVIQSKGISGYFSSIKFPQGAESLLDDLGESDLPRNIYLDTSLIYDGTARTFTVIIASAGTPLPINLVGGNAGIPGGLDGDTTTIQLNIPASASFSVDRFGLLLWQDSFNTAGHTVIGDLTFDSFVVSTPPTWNGDGDFNLDGQVDSYDFALFQAGFAGTVQGDGLPGLLYGDANHDNVVNGADYDILAAGYSAYLADNTAPLPEPSTLLLMVLGCTGLLAYRRLR